MKINNNNNNVNFQAKMFLMNRTLENSARWQKIAEKFEAKTAKNYPEYEMELFKFAKSGRFSITIDRGSSDDLCPRKYALAPSALEKLMQLSDNKIIQKLTKLLDIVKKRDKMMDQLPDDIAKLEKKYGIQLDQNSYDRVSNTIQDKVNSANYLEIAKDDILSGFVYETNIFK